MIASRFHSLTLWLEQGSGQGSKPNKGSIHQDGTTLVRTYLSKSCPMIQHFEFTEASLSFD